MLNSVPDFYITNTRLNDTVDGFFGDKDVVIQQHFVSRHSIFGDPFYADLCALPDVRDGLKPVHRRILYAMNEAHIVPSRPHKKSAWTVGEVMGKYHPHGDAAIYDSMVRMAQDFSMRLPLVDGHGNFGSIDGDPPAAMRYTESRLTYAAMEMLRDLDKETVDWQPNYDETLQEPKVLPARFPNLLVNGSQGIAVGMATNMPPHNLNEAIDAAIAVMENPDITLDELMGIIPGPDFPTGATIMGTQGIRDAYETGRGSITIRSKAHVEKNASGKNRIVVTEIPYQVNKLKLIEKIAELVKQKKLTEISGLNDESDRKGMRIVIDLKRGEEPQVVLNKLYKHTQLQTGFGIINLALVNGVPRVLSLKEILTHYVAHQKDVVTRRTKFDLRKAEERAHILEGLIIALDNIDEVIAIIAGLAAAEVQGVSSMAGNATRDLIEKLGVKSLSKGVKVQVGENTVACAINVNMRYGYNVPETCAEIQDKVKTAIETMTGLEVTEVNIKVVNVVMDNEK